MAATELGMETEVTYEQGLIRDVIAARIPAKLDAGKLFG